MSVLTLNVDEVMRTLSAESSNPFVVHDKEVDIVRFAINSGFADIVLDGQVALRAMYQRPGETEVRAQTLTYYDTDGLHNYYDWQLSQSDLTKDGSLMVALCILDISGGEVSEWHTTPCAVRVLSTIHTDDSDEEDDTITPTVKERVAVLETMIQRVASGAPIVVSSVSAMTDTAQIYVLSTDGMWYYHNGATWVAGGSFAGSKLENGAITAAKLANDVRNKLLHDSEAIGTTDYIFSLGVVDGLLKNDGTIDTTKNTWCTTDYIPISSGNQYVLSRIDFDGNNYSVLRCAYDKNKNFLEFVSITVSSSEYFWNPSSNVAFVRFSVSKNIHESGIAFRKSINNVEKNKLYLDKIASIVENAERDNGIDYVSLLGMSIGRLQSDGTIKDSASFKTTDFIPVKSGMNYKAYVPNTTDFTSYTLYVCTYDSDKNLLSYLVPTVQNRTYYITPSDDTAYIRFSVSLNVSNSGFAFSTVQKRNDIIANKLKNIENALGDFDLISDYGGEEGKIDKNGNVNDDQSFFTTSLIPVVPGLTYALKRINQTDTYAIHKCAYDSNGDLLEYVWFNWESTTRLYTAPYNVKFIRLSYPRVLHDDGLTFGFAKNYIEKSLTERMLPVYNYNGDVVDISVHKKYTCEPMFAGVDRVLPTGKTAQAFAISNNIIFQFLADDMCRLYDYSTQAILGDLSIKCGHANSANFSHVFQEETDEFPLIYLSDTNGNVYVNQITRTATTLIRTLYFDPAVFGNIPQLALDSDSDICYIIGQTPIAVAADNPEYIITVCDLSDLIQSDDKYTPRVISNFSVTIPGEKIVLQGVNYLNGCIWIASGGTSTSVLSRITVIDIQKKAVVSTFTDFPEIASLHEMEDLKFVKNSTASNYDIILHIREYGYYRMIF